MGRARYDLDWSEIGDEEWRPVAENLNYEVSALGQARNVNTGRVLRPFLSGRALRVTLPGPRVRSIHILVCEAFHGAKPSPRHEVDHKDVDFLNNRATNLEWVTPEENHRRYRLAVANNDGHHILRRATPRIIPTGIDEFDQFERNLLR